MKNPILALSACLCLGGCNSTVVETFDPITGKITGRSTTKTLDAEAFTAGANAVVAITAPKGQVVAEK